MSVGCIVETAVEIVEIVDKIVKKESKLRRLIKALRKCCAHNGSSSEEEIAKTMDSLKTGT
jgi:translation initiation factor 1 (eIF-1/SUI1)